jgi:hypothetical protein
VLRFVAFHDQNARCTAGDHKVDACELAIGVGNTSPTANVDVGFFVDNEAPLLKECANAILLFFLSFDSLD